MQRKTESENLINELLAINTQQKAPLTAAKYKISQYVHFKINQSPCTLEKSSSQEEYKRIYSKETQYNLIELFAQNHQDILREEKAGRLNNLPNIADIFYSYYQEMFAKTEINEFLRKPAEDKKRETKDNANVSDGSDELSNIHIDDLDFSSRRNFHFYYLYTYVSNNFCKDPADWPGMLASLYTYIRLKDLTFSIFNSTFTSSYSASTSVSILKSTKSAIFTKFIIVDLVNKLASEVENPHEFLRYFKKIHNTEIRAQVIKEIREKVEPEDLIKLPFDLDKLHLQLAVRTRLLNQYPINDQQADAWLNPEICGLFKYRRYITTEDHLIGIIAAYLNLTFIEANDAVKLLNLMKNIFESGENLFNHRRDTSYSQHSFDKQFGVIPHPILSGYSLFDKKNDSQSAFDKRFGLLPYVSKTMNPFPILMYVAYLDLFSNICHFDAASNSERTSNSPRFDLR